MTAGWIWLYLASLVLVLCCLAAETVHLAPRTFTTLGGLDGGLFGGRHVAVGDFNADGKLDIVTASESHANTFIPGGGLSVLLGNGDFTFQDAVTYANGSNPTALILGDFNQDGRPDIAMANINNGRASSGLVSILLGNPDGTFQNPVNYSSVGANPRALTAGDLNADGITDLAVFNNSSDTAILMGTGNGTFRPAVNYFTRGDGLLSGPIGLAIGDLNNDGRADLIASSTMLYGMGDGSFPNRLLFTYLPPIINIDFATSSPTEVAAGDLNADGNVDLVVAISGTTVVLFGYGNGSFGAPIRQTPAVALGLGAGSTRVSLADMDGDGDLDLVTLHALVGQAGGGVAIWRNDGQGNFAVPIVRSVPFPVYDTTLVTGPDLEVGDLDGDGFFDVVVTDSGLAGTDLNASGGVSVLMGIGNATLAVPVRYLMPPRQSAYGVRLGDLNHDGQPELVMLSSPLGFGIARSSVAVFTNKGNGTFGSAKLLDFGGSAALFLATGDFNGDGSADIIIPNSEANAFNIIFAGDGPVLVTDAPVTVTGTNINPRVGTAFTTTIATFVDDNPFGIAEDFSATIDWGDGQTSTGTISDNPLGGFLVTGTHTYAATGVFTTSVSVRETGAGTHHASATARVNAIDQALSVAGLTFAAIEDLPFIGIVATFTDADSNGSTSDFSALIHWGDGSVSTGIIADKSGGGFNVFGTHVYANPGAFTVIVTINDFGGSSALAANSTAQVALHVNRPPVTIDDSYTIAEDSTLTVTTSRGLHANDTDLDSDTLSSVIVAPPEHGVLTLNNNGSFVYVPSLNFFGIDSFTYRANDGTVDGNLTTVNITVNSVNDAPLTGDDRATTNEDTAVVVNILANDNDLDGTINPTTVVIIASPLHGSLQVNPVTGAVTYTPALNFFGVDSFRYRVRDDRGQLSNFASVSVLVSPVNDAPLANDDSYLVNEDTARIVSAAKGLLANDSDIDGDTLSVTLLAAPTHGVLTIHSNGSFTYIPKANYFGSDSFLYQTGDGHALSLPALVSMTILSVNDAPIVASISDVTLVEGAALMTTAGSFNDVDLSNSWTATVDYGDESGVQTLGLTESTFTLLHDFADSGIYFATVTIVDQDGSIGAVTFEVNVQNLAAVVKAGSDQLVSEGALVSVAANFVDLGTIDTHTALIDWGDGTGPTSVSVSQTAGTGIVSASHVYADNGTYIATLTVTDEEGAVGTDQLTITVGNLPPETNAGPDRTVSEGQLFSLVANFEDPGSTDTHTSIINWGDGTAVETAQVRRAASGWSTTASHRFADDGIYAVSITVRDDDGAADTDILIVEVSNLSPLVDSGPDRTVSTADYVVFPVADFYDLFDEDFGFSRQLRQSGSFVDLGALDTHTATIDWGDGTTEAVPIAEQSFGSLGATAGVSGVVLAQHRYASPGTYSAVVRVIDNDGGIGVDSFVVTVLNTGNNSPIAIDDQANTDEDTPLSIDVLANDSFAPDANETLSVTSITQPAHGAAVISLTGTVSYTPNLNYFGADQFSYILGDGRGGTASATVNLLVNSVNDVATIDGTSTGAVTEGAVVNQVSGVLSVSDPDLGQNLFQTPENLQGTYGVFTFIPSTGAWTYTLDNSRLATQLLGSGQIVSDSLLARSLDGTATRSIVVAIMGQDSPIDVTSLITFRYYGAQYNARTRTYAFYGTITNISNQTIRGPIGLGWSNLLPTTARAKGNTGTWADGSPYFDLSGFVGSDGILQPGETSQPRTFAVTVTAPGAYSFAIRVIGLVSSSTASGEDAVPIDSRVTQLKVTDGTAPESHVSTNVDRNPTNDILVTWGGADEAYGSGVANFDIYVSHDSAAAMLWIQATDNLSAIYRGMNGHTYSFFSVAHDIAGNVEAIPEEMDMETQILFWPRLNSDFSEDVNHDGIVSPLDALLVINSLNSDGSRSVALDPASAPYIDTSADNQVTPLDALLVINYLNRVRYTGEGESSKIVSSTGPLAVASSNLPVAPAVDDYFCLLTEETEDGMQSDNHVGVANQRLTDWRDVSTSRSVAFRIDPTRPDTMRSKTVAKVGAAAGKLNDEDWVVLATDIALQSGLVR